MRVLDPILRRVMLHPFRTFAVDDQRSWSGLRILVAALHLARQIERTTDHPHVGFMLPTSGLAPVALIATWLLGRTAVPVNYLLKESDRAYVLDDAEVDAVVTVGPMIEHFGGFAERIREIRLDEMSFKGLPPLRRRVRRPDDHLAVLLYTSGTSGRPKGVMLTSGNLATNVRQCIEWAGFTRASVMLGVLPQFHTFGLTVLTLLPLSIGARVVYTARFSPRRLLDLLEQHRPDVFIAIPSMYAAILAAKSARREHFASLEFVVSGGEPLPDAVARGFVERFGVTISEGYGLTETSPVTNWCRPHEHKPKSVGPALRGIDERIVDADGRPLPAGQDGEVCIRGPNVMRGYYRLPEETARVFDAEGYFHTGDMGRFDEEGHLYITGRIKEMLIIGGENVFPREIEEVLDAHPSVHASAVIGVPDEARGEVAVAFVELAEGRPFDERALRAHCRAHLAQLKVPREIHVVEKLPRNPTGKIMRRELKATLASRSAPGAPAAGGS
jgi:long-chain acyl-CoA synthetase